MGKKIKAKAGVSPSKACDVTFKSCARRLAEGRGLSSVSAKIDYKIKGLTSAEGKTASTAMKSLSAAATLQIITDAATAASVTITPTTATVTATAKDPKKTSGGTSDGAIIGLSLGSFFAIAGNVL